jgi:hypothetical protein
MGLRSDPYLTLLLIKELKDKQKMYSIRYVGARIWIFTLTLYGRLKHRMLILFYWLRFLLCRTSTVSVCHVEWTLLPSGFRDHACLRELPFLIGLEPVGGQRAWEFCQPKFLPPKHVKKTSVSSLTANIMF